MLGLAAVASARPACEGTAAAILLNMVVGSMCGVLEDVSDAVDSYGRGLWG